MSVPDARPAPLRPLAGLPGIPTGGVCGPDGCTPTATPAVEDANRQDVPPADD